MKHLVLSAIILAGCSRSSAVENHLLMLGREATCHRTQGDIYECAAGDRAYRCITSGDDFGCGRVSVACELLAVERP